MATTVPADVRRSPSSSSSLTSFDPDDALDRELARLGGMRIPSPTAERRLTLEPRLTYWQPPTPDGADPEPVWTARRRTAKAHRMAHPITLPADDKPENAFLASIAQPSSPVPLPASFHAATRNTLTVDHFLLSPSEGQHPPLFVYGHWMIPEQLAAAVTTGAALRRGNKHSPSYQPSGADAVRWAKRMTPAELLCYSRYCMRGSTPTAAVVPQDHEKLRFYHLRGQEQRESVGGHVVIRMMAEEWAALDWMLGVTDPAFKDARIFVRETVKVTVRLQEDGTERQITADTYVYAHNPLGLHVFKEDKKWTPELYVDWHRKTRTAMQDGNEEDAAASSGCR